MGDSIYQIIPWAPALGDRGTYWNFVLSTWLPGLYFGSDYWHQMREREFMTATQTKIEKHLERSDTHIFVAVLKEDSDVILGYLVGHCKTLDWIFVKKAFRGMGIAKTLFNSSVFPYENCSNLTRVGAALRRKQKLSFNPFI